MAKENLIFLLKADLLRLAGTKKNTTKIFFLLRGLFNPRFIPVVIIRLSRYFYLKPPLRIIGKILTWLNIFLFGIECTPRCKIGPGILLPHTVGTVIGAREIGDNATIFQGVTLGANHADLLFDEKMRPTIGKDVVIGSGAKVLGGISIGNNSKIGANAVVLDSIDEGLLVVGIPATTHIPSQK